MNVLSKEAANFEDYEPDPMLTTTNNNNNNHNNKTVITRDPLMPKISKNPFLQYVPLTKKNDSSPFLTLITDHILEKKFSIIAFRHNLPNILHATIIFRSTIMIYLKSLLISLLHKLSNIPSLLLPNFRGKPCLCVFKTYF